MAEPNTPTSEPSAADSALSQIGSAVEYGCNNAVDILIAIALNEIGEGE